MRLYHFSHFMLSSIAKGIQNTHSTAEMFIKCGSPDACGHDVLFDWAISHKTIISLNCGTSPDIQGLIKNLSTCDDYPWAFFREDESLGNIITSVSIVLPEKIYEMASLVRQRRVTIEDTYFQITNSGEIQELTEQMKQYGDFTEFDMFMIQELQKYRLAS